jgi:PTH1 family peptidyl-tRNA hydrolase
VGLGNPGPTYALTRHNIGARVIEELAKRNHDKLSKHSKALALVSEFRHGDHKVIAAAPQSYMNESGGPTKALAQFYKVDPSNIIVLHDELDISLGTIRAKLGGGDNGHNGLKSLRSAFGTGDFFRIRLGIGRPPGQQDPADFVLKNFAAAEKTDVEFLISNGADAVETLISYGLEETQQRFNS